MTSARPRFWRLAPILVLVAALLCAAAPSASAQVRRSVVERYDSWEAYEARRIGFLANDVRVVDMETCREPNGPVWWVAVYNHLPNSLNSAGFDDVLKTSEWSEFNAEVDRGFQDGWRIDDIDANPVNASPGGHYFLGLFNPGAGAQAMTSLTTWWAFNSWVSARRGEGMRLVDLDVAVIDGQKRYYGVMRQGATEEQLVREASWADFNTQRQLLSGQGWRLRDIAFASGEFIGVFNRGNGPHVAETFADWPGLLARWGQLDNAGRGRVRLVDVECWSEGGTMHYAGVWRGDRRVRPEANPNVGPAQQPSPPSRPTAPSVDRSGGN